MYNVQEMEERDYHPETPFNLDIAETRACGDLYPDRPWLLSDYDVWVKNPAYRGPEVPHPEYDYGDWDEVALNQELVEGGAYDLDRDMELDTNVQLRDIPGLKPLNSHLPIDDLPF